MQKFLTVSGLVCDIAGFTLIAIEWYRGFEHGVGTRDRELESAAEQLAAEDEDREVCWSARDEDAAMAGLFSKLHHQEANRRRWLVGTGFALVLIGFILQIFGAIGLPSLS